MQVFDVYQGKGIPEGKKSYAISFVLQDKEKTLTDKQIEGVMTKLIAKFKNSIGAELR
jgi:phenylalanyl-tRNA synthetase beta chain